MRLLLLVAAGCSSKGVLLEVPPEDPPSTPSLPTAPPPTPTPTPVATPPDPGCGSFTAEPEGAFLVRQIPISNTLPECTTGSHAFAGARGSTVSLQYEGEPAVLTVTDLLGVPLVEVPIDGGSSLEWTLAWSGEHLVEVQLDDDGGQYSLESACVDACDLEYTRYPLFFMHGMAGTEEFLAGLTYWYQVKDTLEPLGFAVHTESVDPFQSSEVRAEQWQAHLEAVVATGEARRFNLVAHSQGGIDARRLAALLDPDGRVRSVTTISTPHRGTVAGDLVSGVLTDVAITGVIVDAMFDGLGQLYGNANDQDITAQLESLSVSAMTDFNATVPDRADVSYFSWAGRSCQLLDLFCQNGNGGEIVTPLFSATHFSLQLFEGDNDGLVSVQSAEWGAFLGVLPADHLDEVGLLPGTTAPGFDHLEFYTAEAVRLASLGL